MPYHNYKHVLNNNDKQNEQTQTNNTMMNTQVKTTGATLVERQFEKGKIEVDKVGITNGYAWMRLKQHVKETLVFDTGETITKEKTRYYNEIVRLHFRSEQELRRHAERQAAYYNRHGWNIIYYVSDRPIGVNWIRDDKLYAKEVAQQRVAGRKFVKAVIKHTDDLANVWVGSDK